VVKVLLFTRFSKGRIKRFLGEIAGHPRRNLLGAFYVWTKLFFARCAQSPTCCTGQNCSGLIGSGRISGPFEVSRVYPEAFWFSQ